jgi:hypothetical protein
MYSQFNASDLVRMIECEVRAQMSCCGPQQTSFSCTDVQACVQPTITNIYNEITEINNQITEINNTIENLPLFTTNTNTLFLSGAGTETDPLKGDVQVSAQPFNGIQILDDGLYDAVPIQTQLVYGGEVIWTGVGYTYKITAAGYYINFVFYESPETFVTLDPADTTFNRLDTFIVTTASTASFITGTPSDNPAEPPLDTATQLRLSAAFVGANTVIPVQDQCIYLENTEWTTLSNDTGRINPDSLTTPCSDLKVVEGTNVLDGDNILFTNPMGNFVPHAYNFIEFNIKSKGAWLGAQLHFQWELLGAPVGSAVTIAAANYGFDELNTTTCQTIVIPINDFTGLTFATEADSIRITAVVPTTFSGFILDNMCISTSSTIPAGSASSLSLLFNNGLTRTGNTVQFGGTLLHATTLQTGTFVQTFASQAVYNYGYQFSAAQTFENGTGITSFLKTKGSSDPLAADINNTVRLGINYTSNIYNSPSDLNGYMGATAIGYWMGVNGTGHGSFGIYTDNSLSKTGGIFYHTLDSSNTDMVTIFGKQPPTANSAIGISAGGVGFFPYRIAVFHTDKSSEFLGKTYLNAARFEMAKGANVASANNLTLGTDGNLFHITGTVQINAITVANWQAGSDVTFIFDGITTVKHNTAGGAGTAPIILAGAVDFTTAVNDAIILSYDGTSWHEVGRKLASSGGGGVTANSGLIISSLNNVQLGGTVGTPSPLLKDSYIAAGAFDLFLTGTGTGNGLFQVTSSAGNAVRASAAGGIAVYGTSNTTAVYGETSGTDNGVYGAATGAGTGVKGFSQTDKAMYALTITGLPISAQATPASTGTVVTMLQLIRSTTGGGGVGTDGIGGSIDFYNNSSTTTQLSNQIISKLTTAANATRTSSLEWWGVNSATSLKKAELDSATGFTVYSTQTTALTTAELNTTPNAWTVGGGAAFVSAGRYSVSGASTISFNFGTITVGDKYVITYTVNNVLIGGSITFAGVTEGESSGGSSGNFKQYIKATSTSGTMTITMTDTGGGAYIEAISVKRLTTTVPIAFANNTENTTNEFEVRSDNATNSMFVGKAAGSYNYSLATFNTAFGHQALENNAVGDFNVAIGYQALQNDGRAVNSVAIGYRALAQTIHSRYNTAVGVSSQANSTRGWNNTSLGAAAMASVTTGTDNIAVGYNSLVQMTTGVYNTVMGSSAALALSTGNNNTIVGGAAAGGLTTGSQTVVLGTAAAGGITTGSGNIAVGYAALVGVSTGDHNISIGYLTGNQQFSSAFDINQNYASHTADNKSIFIGSYANFDKAADALATNAIAIGYEAHAYQSNQAVFGNTSITSTFLRGDVELRNYTTLAATNIADPTIPAATTKWAVTGAVTLGTNYAEFNANTSLSGTLKQTQANMAIAGKSGRYYRLEINVSYPGVGPLYQPLTITVTGNTFASTDLVLIRPATGAGGSATYHMFFKSKTTPTDLTFTFSAASIVGDGLVRVTNINLYEVTGGDMFVNRNLEVYGGAVKLTTQFTPANATDATYAIGTMTADDSFLWYRKSNGNWVKAAWAAF